MIESNYEKAKRNAAKLFCQTDHTELIRHFSLVEEEGFLFLRFFEQPFRLNLKTGLVERQAKCAQEMQSGNDNQDSDANQSSNTSQSSSTAQNGWLEAHFNESMVIYDLLGYAQLSCRASNSMANMKSIHMKVAATAPNSNNFYRDEEALFAQNPAAFQHALAALGGRPASGKADIAAQFTCLADLTMEVRFWLPDEDFPPSLQFFWDNNVLSYMHYETVWYANGFIVDEIKKLLAAV